MALVEPYLPKIKADNSHGLMRANETVELLKMAKLTVQASMQREESGRACYWRTDYPNQNPDLNKVLVLWQENGRPKFSWGI